MELTLTPRLPTEPGQRNRRYSLSGNLWISSMTILSEVNLVEWRNYVLNSFSDGLCSFMVSPTAYEKMVWFG
jgi:hypothetical protein